MNNLLAPIVIVLLCAYNARALWDTWLYSPYDQVGGIMFLGWLLPLLFCKGKLGNLNIALWVVALVISTLGVVIDINQVCYLGLALAIVGFCPVHWFWSAVWFITACSWMPALGYFASQFELSVEAVQAFRGAIAFSGIGGLYVWSKLWGK